MKTVCTNTHSLRVIWKSLCVAAILSFSLAVRRDILLESIGLYSKLLFANRQVLNASLEQRVTTCAQKHCSVLFCSVLLGGLTNMDEST
jgi:hypothetical protein